MIAWLLHLTINTRWGCINYRGGKKPGLFSKVCNCCILHKDVPCITVFCFIGSKTGVLSVTTLNILCTSLVKQNYTHNNTSPFTSHGRLPVPQHAGVHRTAEISTEYNSDSTQLIITVRLHIMQRTV